MKNKEILVNITFPLEIRFRWRPRQTIPIGFKSYKNSIPMFFSKILFPKIHENEIYAITAYHYICQTHPNGWSKYDCDDMLYEFMIDNNISKLRAFLRYLDAYLFGWIKWKKNK